ncbi:hypothetical protein PIB30_117226 [Stylosanthes scabra]|nr:hypothetical protein [Stylosanthes scabra]
MFKLTPFFVFQRLTGFYFMLFVEDGRNCANSKEERELGFRHLNQKKKNTKATMIYDVNSPLFRSFLSQKGGSSDKRKTEEQKPKEQRPKASENKPVMTE